MSANYCKCGCKTKIKIWSKRWNKPLEYARGHNWKGQSRGGMSLEQKLGRIIECACGCGDKITEYRVKKDGRRYKVKMQVGHNRKGKAVSHFWKGGITELNENERRTFKARRWKQEVLRRDNYTCVLCGARNHRGKGKTIVLNADHIKSWSNFPELRYELSNGRTLCVDCHKQTSNYAGRARTSKT